MTGLVALVVATQLGAASQIDRAVADGIADGVFPGAVVVVGTRERVLYAEGHGSLTWTAADAVPSPDTTLCDLASLTKVVATTPAIMLLVDAGRVSLDERVQHYLAGFTGSGKEAVTVRHLLEHRSGLRAFLPLNELAESAADARRLVLKEPLRWPPGRQVVYGDLNAMLLGWIVERVSGMGLDRFIESELFAPLELPETRFRPPPEMRHRIAPVGLWRGHVIAGRIHDQNAAILGGVAGHAGLYSTGRDLARYAQLWLRRGRNAAGRRVLRAETIAEFTTWGADNRALGWEMRDTVSQENTGLLLSRSAYGHGGYTGTSIWIDPEQDLFVIVLTNRVFAPRERNSIRALKRIRARVADAAVKLRLERCSLRAAYGAGADRC